MACCSKARRKARKGSKRWYSSDSSICKPILTLVYTPIDTATTVRVYPGGNNSSKGDIKVNWNPQTGVKVRAYLDGKPVEASGGSYTLARCGIRGRAQGKGRILHRLRRKGILRGKDSQNSGQFPAGIQRYCRCLYGKRPGCVVLCAGV